MPGIRGLVGAGWIEGEKASVCFSNQPQDLFEFCTRRTPASAATYIWFRKGGEGEFCRNIRENDDGYVSGTCFSIYRTCK